MLGLASILAIFILPVVGMHRHLVDDKEQALREVRQALETAFKRLHDTLAGVEPAATATLTTGTVAEQIDALVRQEQYLMALPTWPWPPGTLAKLLSVALLPLLLLMAQQVIEWFFIERLLR
ncbi:MAG: hypothetical protein IT329_11185 [Caldilineaceae bacterium]|nr:hypothetical protein [Caldilineaceae bacterium]